MLNPHTKLNAFSALDHIFHWNNHMYMVQMLYISTSVLHLSYATMVQESSSSIISLTPLTSIYIIWHCDLSCGLLFATSSSLRILGTVGDSFLNCFVMMLCSCILIADACSSPMSISVIAQNQRVWGFPSAHPFLVLGLHYLQQLSAPIFLTTVSTNALAKTSSCTASPI